MKKILIISPFNIFPPYWGGASRIYNLVNYLAKENKVILLCNDYKQIKKADANCGEYRELSSNPNIRLYFIKSLGRGSQIFNHLFMAKGLKVIRNEKPDFIVAEFAWSGFHAIFFHLMSSVPYILDEHNIEFLRFERMKRGNRVTRLLLKVYEHLSCIFSSKIFCVSEVDRDILVSKLGIRREKIIVIPNGIDTNKFYPNEQKRMEIRTKLNLNDEPVILFFGKLDYKPNYEAIKIIRNVILPKILKKKPKAKFLIVGSNPPLEYNYENIIFVGMVENIEDYINASDIVICPLLSGGGTRIKILEALACGKVVISTAVGAEGIVNNSILIITDGWDKFATQCIESLSRSRNPILGIPTQIFDYSWEAISKKICNYIDGK